ncbi:thioredoxin family protein [Sporosarcina sp. G11-34]|uniref:thioredoxin family protein n=1 Tax=Sporosarcina sp. G11-34 TaxID=2849605 RepID=UPI0022A8E4CF|nr:thioredoxin family protein [Sporosarcina sp. G11-34]MCZ2259982.1 thioredoxin family protein [Sporosarcina sp. G11-34]
MRKLINGIIAFIILALIVLVFVNVTSDNITNNKISITKINDVLENDESTFVFVGKRSCQECKKFQPILEEAAKRTDTSVYYLDTENAKNESFLIEHNIQGTPTLLIIKEGVIERVEGYQEYNVVENILLGKI